MTVIENKVTHLTVPKLSVMIVEKRPNHFRHLTVGAIVGTAMVLCLYFLTIDNHFAVALEAIFSISGVIAYAVLLMSYWAENMHFRKFAYRKALTKFNQNELIKLTMSPELDNTEQALVVEFLNQTYPGWSFLDTN